MEKKMNQTGLCKKLMLSDSDSDMTGGIFHE